MRFDLTDLKLFLAVVESGSITAGAERSALALASASARIRGMEDMLGHPLLVRGRRGVAPTPAGRTLAHHARMVLQQMERMRGDLAQYARGLKGHVRLMANTAAISEFLPEALSAFLAAHPHVDVDLEERLSFEIVDAVAEGLADVGIVADSVDSAELELLPFRVDRLSVVSAHGHPLADLRECRFSDTLPYPFIGLSEGSALQEHLAGHAARCGQRLNYRVRLRSFDAICRMVERGVGIAVMPEAAAIRCQRSMAVARTPLTDSWATRQLNICVRRFDDLPAHTHRLIEALTPRDTP